MESEEVKAYVTKADDREIRVKILKDSFGGSLVNIGFVFDNDLSEYTFLTKDEREKASMFEALRQLDVYFSGGREWCPSEIFEDLRGSGYIDGTFNKISWSSPGSYHITVV